MDISIYPSCNLYELVYKAPHPLQSEGLHSVSLSQTVFETLLAKAKTGLSMKPSYKRFKKYRVDTKSIEHSGDPNEDIKVFDTHVRHVDSVSANWLWVALQKDKLAYHTFPCTQALMDVHLLERIVFRMHHRVFLNFERQIYEDGSFVYRVFMNYNHDSSVDQSSIISAIEKVMSVLQP